MTNHKQKYIITISMLKIIQAGTSLGTLANHGTELAPLALLNGGLTEALVKNKLSCEVLPSIPDRPDETDKQNQLYNLNPVVEFNQALYHQIVSSMGARDRFLTLGGDHSIAIGSLMASKKIWPQTCVIYIDAHPDCSSPTDTLSGYIHGMPLSTVMGDGLYARFEHAKYAYDEVFIIGAKDIDEAEFRYLERHKIRYITIDEIIERGIAEITLEIIKQVGPRPVHVSLDIDSIDGQYAPGTGIVNHGGLTYREVSYLARRLADLAIRAVDVVEINPTRDIENKTVDLGIELAVALLGGSWSDYNRYMGQQHE